MKEQQHSIKFLRRRKFLLVAPVLVIPFVTMLFWALGGGKGAGVMAADASRQPGLNLQLPDANFKKDKLTDKLGYYEKAEADSAKIRDMLKKDPYVSGGKRPLSFAEDNTDTEAAPFQSYTQRPALTPSPYIRKKYEDPNEARVYKKLDELNKALNEKHNIETGDMKYPRGDSHSDRDFQATELDNMMQQFNAGGNNSGDTSLQQINTVLEKVLDLQYPQRMREKLQKQSAISTGQVFAVTMPEYKSTISLLDTAREGFDNNSNAFFSAYDGAGDTIVQNTIEAVMHETQTLVNGAVVKMRLMNDLFINGQLVRKGNFIFGTAILNNERLEIAINSIRNENTLLPVKLDVYDLDGLRGIYIPGAITREVAKQSSDNALQSIALSSLDPSIGAQAASAGIETAKNLLTKRIKIVRVQVKAGYKILLKDNNQQP